MGYSPTSLDKFDHLPLVQQQALGQYTTPSSVAKFMASLFQPTSDTVLLDAGAGIGMLSAAFMERIGTAHVTAYEIDKKLHPQLQKTLKRYVGNRYSVISEDFILNAAQTVLSGQIPRFTHAILNPPYKKIRSDSKHRLMLRKVGIETVNLYSAFVALAILLMKPQAELVTIIPRSFCNGLYYKPFREFLLKQTVIRQIHLFDARDALFEGVLQENVILHLVKSDEKSDVCLSTSTDAKFADYQVQRCPYDEVVVPHDFEKFIRIPKLSEPVKRLGCKLGDLGIQVSTGPVVDFRLKQHLRSQPLENCVPLLYPAHFIERRLSWPLSDSKKPNAIEQNKETRKWLFPNGFYVVVRRFSSKEEPRRIVASVVNPAALDYDSLGFENHLNVFHCNKKGLNEAFAYGLAAFLNSTIVDTAFRQFNGHTQVNATDLRSLTYPHYDQLIHIGKKVKDHNVLDLKTIDELVFTSL